MKKSICGADCETCNLNGTCSGCENTNGEPFGERCFIASCCQSKKQAHCDGCKKSCDLKNQLIKEFNDLKIVGMETVTDLNALKGSFVNLEFKLQNGQTIKLLNDNKIYFGNQLCKAGSDRCYGLAGDENYLLVCEYGTNGENAKIIAYLKRIKHN